MSEAKARNDLRKKMMFAKDDIVQKAFMELEEIVYIRKTNWIHEGVARNIGVSTILMHPDLLMKV